MRTAIVVVAILFASWLTGIVSHSMLAFTTVFGSASLVATVLKIDSVAKRRAERRRLAWDAAYQHNAYMAGFDKLGTEGRYPSSAADLPAMGASVLNDGKTPFKPQWSLHGPGRFEALGPFTPPVERYR